MIFLWLIPEFLFWKGLLIFYKSMYLDKDYYVKKGTEKWKTTLCSCQHIWIFHYYYYYLLAISKIWNFIFYILVQFIISSIDYYRNTNSIYKLIKYVIQMYSFFFVQSYNPPSSEFLPWINHKKSKQNTFSKSKWNA